jgi:hypothetical protein
MLENSIYSVISPEGCSSILWKDNTKTVEAASALKLTAEDMLKIDVIDEIVKEPSGGAHRNPHRAIESVGDEIEKYLNLLSNQHGNDLKHARQERYLQIGRSGLFSDKTTAANTVLDEKFGKSGGKKRFYNGLLPKFILVVIAGMLMLGLLVYLFN